MMRRKIKTLEERLKGEKVVVPEDLGKITYGMLDGFDSLMKRVELLEQQMKEALEHIETSKRMRELSKKAKEKV